MFGWINECTEKLVVSKFGLEKWHEIKELAGCDVADNGFVRHEVYTDASTVELVVAASQILGLSVEAILEAFGVYFMEFVRAEGFENLLSCQGNTLRTWMSNINALHDHLESSFPKGMIKPVFWVENDEDNDGSILLHYFSKRGSLLAPVVVGVVKEVARFHFGVVIEMDRLNTQDEEGAKFSTWRVTAADPTESWKITTLEKPSNYQNSTQLNLHTSGRCPFSGVMMGVPSPESSTTTSGELDDSIEASDEALACPMHRGATCTKHEDQQPKVEISRPQRVPASEPIMKPISLSADMMKQIFPYHIIVDEEFQILQIGNQLPRLVRKRENLLLGSSLRDLLRITKPVHGVWDWTALRKLEDQTFFMDLILTNTATKFLKLKGNLTRISEDPLQVMLVLSPDAKNVGELQDMKLTMSDLPLQSFQRDAVFLGEHIVSEVKTAHKLDKMSKRLQKEKDLSNALLYSLLPRHVANELRAGGTVEPQLHEDVTMFFSDVVGFTKICDGIEAWDVIEMLNRLYCMMDFLARKFQLFKVETVGDAYVAACGLPHPDDYHAENIANFAIAVRHCSKLVLSPLDGEPIRLRIGVHTGPCTTGVAGTILPRYCVFGDTINTTSRHESTGCPGMIQCSSVTFSKLMYYSECETIQFKMSERGLVEMKGKGQMLTYWLDGGTRENKLVNDEGLLLLENEVKEILSRQKFSRKKYFRRAERRGSAWSAVSFECELDLDDQELDFDLNS